MLLALLEFSLRRPKSTAVAVLALCGAAAAGLPRVRLEMDGRALLAPDSPARAAQTETRGRHGIRDAILVALETGEPQGALTDQFLARLNRLDARLAREVPGAADILGLATLQDVRWLDGAPRQVPFFDPDRPETPAQRSARLRELGFFDSLLISPDRRAACTFVELTQDASRDAAFRAVTAILAEEGLGPPVQSHIAGAPVAEAMMGERVLDDLARLVPVVVLVVGGVLWLAFRSAPAVLAPLLALLLTIAGTFGMLGWAGVPVTLVMATLPVLWMAIGITDEIHLFYRFSEECGRARSVRHTCNLAWSGLHRAVLFTTLTTSVGFAAFTATPLPAVADFGWVAAVGLLANLLLTYSLVPALLVLWPPRMWRHGRSRPLARSGPWRPRTVLFAALAAAALMPLGWRAIEVQDRWIGNFAPNDPIRIADAYINDRFLSTHVLLVRIEDGSGNTLAHPTGLRRIADLEQWLAARSEVAGVRSIAGLIRMAEMIRAPDSPAGQPSASSVPLPKSLGGVREDLLWLTGPVPGERLRTFLSDDRRSALLHVFLRDADYRKTRAVVAATQQRCAAGPESLHVQFAGDAFLSQALVRGVVDGQLRSLATALLVVLALCALAARSLRWGAVHLVPVLLCTGAVFAAMGASGLHLGVATSMFAPLSVGIGIDYAVHWIARYRAERCRGSSPATAAAAVRCSAGRAIALSALVMALGCAMLALSSVPPNRQLGLLLTASMALAWIATAAVLPALVRAAHW